MQKINSFVSRREKQGTNMDFKVAIGQVSWGLELSAGRYPYLQQGVGIRWSLRSLHTKACCDCVPAVEIHNFGWMVFPSGTARGGRCRIRSSTSAPP